VTPKKPLLGLVLSGGGARGAYQAGVYSSLVRDGRYGTPDVLAGTSAGAINAALIACGKTPAQIVEFWLKLGDDPPAAINPKLNLSGVWSALKTLPDFAKPWPSASSVATFLRHSATHVMASLGVGLPTAAVPILAEWLLTQRFELVDDFLNGMKETAIADTHRLRGYLIDALGGETVKTDRALAVSAVDALEHHVVRFVNRERLTPSEEEYVVVPEITVDMVLASAAIPILFPAVTIEIAGQPRSFWDGGVLVNTPMAPAVALGADEIVPVLSTEGKKKAHGFRGLGDAIEHLTDMFLENSYNADRALLLERNRHATSEIAHEVNLAPDHYRRVTLYEPVRPRGRVFDAGSYLYFERHRLERMAAAGKAAANHWLAGPPKPDTLKRR
jgi:NTE family protein